MACSHSGYWRGSYGTCMVCRAETAESERDDLAKEVERLKDELEIHKMGWGTCQKEIGKLKAELEALEEIRIKDNGNLLDERDDLLKDRNLWKSKAKALAEALKYAELFGPLDKNLKKALAAYETR